MIHAAQPIKQSLINGLGPVPADCAGGERGPARARLWRHTGGVEYRSVDSVLWPDWTTVWCCPWLPLDWSPRWPSSGLSLTGWSASSASLTPGKGGVWSGYQLTQSLMAIGRGGVFGLGLGSRRFQTLLPPEAHTDFILAVTAEEARVARRRTGNWRLCLADVAGLCYWA